MLCEMHEIFDRRTVETKVEWLHTGTFEELSSAYLPKAEVAVRPLCGLSDMQVREMRVAVCRPFNVHCRKTLQILWPQK